MKTLLLIAGAHPGFIESLQVIGGLRVVQRATVAEAATAIAAGVFDLALLVQERWTDESGMEVHRVRAAAPRLPVIVATPLDVLPLAYAAGADAALPWPETSHVVPQIVQRWLGSPPIAAGPSLATRSASAYPWPLASLPTQSPLEVLREFSKVLSHSLDETSFAQRLVEQLAEILGVVRIALFLEPEAQMQPVSPGVPPDPRLNCVAATGIPAELTACLELSREGGLGRMVTTRRGVLSKYSPHVQGEQQGDHRVLQEFEVLSCDMALPVRDRDRVIGVAVLGERITGSAFTTEELNLAYFLMGELGMAIRNSRLHRMLAGNHRLLSSILESISSGSLVVGPDLRVMHANRAAGALLGVAQPRNPAVSDLPAPVLQSVHAVVAKGADSEPLFHEVMSGARRLLRFSIVPLQTAGAAATSRPVIVLIEDWTQIQAAKEAAVETANTRLISTIAARFAHEIRNSLVPLSTHSQLFESEGGNAEFLDSLRTSLHRETLRIRRFSDLMLFLACPETPPDETASLSELLKQAFSLAQDIANVHGELLCSIDGEPRLRCARESLTYALQEILANALQSNTRGAVIRVKAGAASGENPGAVVIDISDNGPGFTPETAARATEPFYTTRNTGVGLGLSVARRIIEQHGGRLAIRHRTLANEPDIRIILPLP